MIPELRFNDDTTEWVEDTLSSILVEVDERKTLESGMEHVSLTQEGVVPKSSRYERDFLVTDDNKKYRVTRYNDICYNPANLKFGVICRNTYKDGLFSPIYITFNTTNDAMPEFVELNVTRESFIKDALQYQQGTVYERMAVSPEDLGKMPISIPLIPIQEEIATLLSNMDIKIKAQSEKVENLKQIKDSMLVKMFPQEGQKVPEIRFDGFSGDWDETDMSTVGIYSKGKGYSKNDLSNEGTPIILYGRLYTNYSTEMNNIDTFVTPVANSVYSTGIEVIVPASGETAEDIAIASCVTEPNILLGGDLNIIKPYPQYNGTFLALTISNGDAKKILATKAQGKSVVHLHNEDIKQLNVYIPSLPEQTAIGNFFKILDEKITLETERLDKFTQIKKALLNKLLP